MSSINVNLLCLGCMSMLPHPKAVCPNCGWSRQTSHSNASQLAQGITLTNPKSGAKYLIGKAVGQGGFGIVYVAFDMTNNRKVAIKEYYPTQFVTRDHSGQVIPLSNTQANRNFLVKQKRRFYQEAEKMQLFNDSPSVVNVLDYFEANDTAYIVMEFIEGQTFAQVLSRMQNERLPLQTVLANLKPIVDILERIHHTPYNDDKGIQHPGITHRDISPENIMYAVDGTIKLLDFGAARVSDPGDPPTGILKPGYAPCEQQLVQGPGAVQGPWTDVYALAATIYRAITGQVPPNAVTRLGADSIILPSAMGIEITPKEEQILLKGLAVKYQDRYQSVSQFYNDLITSNIAEPLQPPQTSQPVEEPLWKKLSWVVAAVVVIGALMLLNKVKAHEIELANIQEQIQSNENKLEKFREFAADYGYASASYHAEKAIIFLDKNSEAKFWIHFAEKKGTSSFICEDGDGIINAHWENNEPFENNKANFVISSGNRAGYATIHFTNTENNNSFDVLAVVK